MHSTIRSYSGVPGLVDGILANQEEITRLLRDIPGFQAYYLIRTGETDAMSVSVYDDQGGTDASSQLAREWIAANLPGLAVSPPTVSAGEVVLRA